MFTINRRRAAIACSAVAALLLTCGFSGDAGAESLSGRANRGLVEIMTGGGDGSSIQMVQDLANVLDDGAARRLLPVVGRGAVQNLIDLRALRGVDIAIVQTDALDAAKRRNMVPAIESSITYIAKLYDEELHILARSEIGQIEDLAGKKVEFGGGGAVTGPAVLDALHVKVDAAFDDYALAMQKLRSGEVAAVVYVAAKPTSLFGSVKPQDGFHFLAIPLNAELANAYVPAQLTAEDYPGLVVGKPIDTIAVGTVMVAANLPPNTERYRNVANFVDAFFTQFPHLQQAPRQPKWAEVNLAAEFPGLKRFPPADQWLKRNAVAAAPALGDKEMHQIFSEFLDERSRLSGGHALSMKEKDQLFDQFRHWQTEQAH